MSNILNVVVSEQEPDIPVPDTSPDTGVYTATSSSDYANDTGMDIVLPVSVLLVLLVVLTSTLIYKLTHKNKKLEIAHKKFGIFIFFLAFSVGAIGAFAASYFSKYGVNAANNVDIITTDTTIRVTRGDEPSFAKAKAEIIIKDETTDGFDLYVYAPSGNVLTNGSSEIGINPVEGAGSALAINTWGATDSSNSNVIYSDAVWNPVSATESEPLLIATTNDETVSGKKVTVYYGVYVDSDLPVGTYSANIEYKLDVHPSTHYKVCYDANGGTIADTCKTVAIGEPVGELPEPTREYYNFAGWFDAAEGGNQITAATVLDEKTTIYAHWDRITYAITFDANGGEIAETDASKTVNAGDSLGSLPEPTRENYSFVGWFTAAEGGDRITTATMPTAATTYFAHWSKDTRVITFDANGGEIAEADATRTIEAGDAVGTLPEATYTYYELVGWFDAAEGGNEITAATVPSGAVTYYAHWQRIVSTVTFDANGGVIDAADATRNVNVGEAVGTLPSATLENYDFLGWFTAPVDGDEISAATIVTEKTVTYYAHYNVVVRTITFDANGGTIAEQDATRYINAGSALGELPQVSRENYTFVGWFTAAEGGDEISAATKPDSSRTYYAHWDRITHTITFNANGGSIAEQDATRSVNAGEAVGELPSVTRTNYELVGWFDAAEGGNEITAATVPAGATTYYAHWNRQTYTISFDANGGVIAEQDATRTVNAGDGVGTLPEATYTYYELVGWFDAAEGGNEITAATVPSGAVTYYAHWQRIVSTVTFDANGGVIAEQDATRSVNEGEAVGELPSVTREHYDFAGWFTAAVDGEQISAETIVTEQTVSYFAHWQQKQYTITFDANGGTIAEQDATRNVDGGNTLGELPSATKEGMDLLGWFTDAENGEQVYADTTPDSTTTYYAHWGKESYTITFDGNGGVPSEASRSVESGSVLGELPTATLDGYELAGWFTDAEGGTQVYADTVPDGTTTYYAHWNRSSYNIIFDANGGSFDDISKAIKTVDTGEALGELPTVSYTYYNFAGWFTKRSGGIEIDANTKPDADTTYYAHWERIVYTITFVGNGGEIVEQTRDVFAGKQIGDLHTATRDGYAFKGWYTSTSYGTQVTASYVPTGSIKVYAQWRADDFPIVWSQTGACDFNAYKGSDNKIHGLVSGEECSEYAGDEYIDTGVKLYNTSSTLSENYEIGFTIDHFAGSEQKESQATIMNTKSEATNQYPGVLFRRYNGSDKLEISSRKTSGANATFTAVPESDITSVRIVRKNGSIYYAFNGGELIELNSLDDFNPTFDQTVWFGASPAKGASRFIVGTLSNMYIRVGSYREMHTVTFDPNGGTVNEPIRTVQTNYSIGELPLPVLEGYSFAGWWTELEGGTRLSTSTYIYNDATYYAHWEKKSYLVSFEPNGGTVSESTRKVGEQEEIGALPKATRRDYTNTGWYTYPSGGEEVTSDYVPIEDMNVYADWTIDVQPLRGVTYFQDFANLSLEQEQAILDSMKEDVGYSIKDKRDNKEYVIVKLAGDRLYMREDLRLDGVVNYSARVLTPADSDVTSDYTMPTSVWGSYYCKASMKQSDSGSYLYNWYAAKANPYECENPTSYTNATEENDAKSLGSICPAGWTLPDYSTDILPSTLYKNGYNPGNLINDSVWSSDRYSDSSSYYIYNSSDIYRSNNSKAQARAVRCMRQGNVVTFDANGGDIRQKKKNLKKGTAVGDLPIPSREGYDFVGWYTSLEDGELIDEDYTPGSSTTVYAHWSSIEKILAGVTYFQDFDRMTAEQEESVLNAMQPNVHYAIKDERDDKEYTIIKLDSGYLWMEENLKLDGFDNGEARVLTPSDSDVSANYTMPTEEWTSYSQNYYCKAIMAEANGEYYYNWYAAKANPYECVNPTSSSGATAENDAKSLGSICPAGWTLPDYTTDVLPASLYSNTDIKGDLSVSGNYYSGTARINYYGYFWSSKGRTDSYDASVLVFYKQNDSISVSLSPYYDKVYGYSVRCIRSTDYSISLNANGGLVDIDKKKVEKGKSVGELPTPTNEVGYIFVGWFTALIGGEQVSDDFKPNSDMELYAHWKADVIDNVESFQDFANMTEEEETAALAAMEENASYGLIDERDGKEYVVTKLSDGRLYMRENLKLDSTTDGTTPRVLTPSDSDVSSNYTMPTEDWASSSQNYYCKAIMKEYNGEYYYNWYAAKANPYECENPTNSTNATEENDAQSLGSICPVGWTLPDYSTDVLPGTLFRSDGKKNFGNLYSSGAFYSGSINSNSGYSYYWSSSRYTQNNQGSAYLLYAYLYSNGGSVRRTTGSKYSGYSVRCMRQSVNTITFDSNGGTGAVNKKSFAWGDKVGELPVPTRKNYTFEGWYTSVDGGEKIDEEFIPNNNITVYAHWDNEMSYIPGITYFQEFAWLTYEQEVEVLSNMEINTKYLIKDQRDEKEYIVIKLSSGYLYMAEDLRLSGVMEDGENRILTSGDSDVISDFTMPNTWASSRCKSYMNINNDGKYSYNWYAATANPSSCESSSTSNDDKKALGSICPAGWTLPDYDSDILPSAFYDGFETVVDLGSTQYWSGLRYSDDYAYALDNTGTVMRRDPQYRDNGLLVRCMRDTKYRIKFNANGSSKQFADMKVKKGESVGELPVPTRTNYTFVGWYTALDGGEKIESDYNIVNDITLYARWESEAIKIPGIESFQDFANMTEEEETAALAAMEENASYGLIDERDGKEYVVTKLSDGRLYMRENLKLDSTTDGTTPRVLTPSDSDVSSNYTMPTEDWASSSQNYYCKAIMKEYNGEYYYNWYAAKANPYECENPTNSTNATEENDAQSLGSICPAGWSLPSYGTDIALGVLYDGSNNYAKFEKTGYFYDGYVYSTGQGFYWSYPHYDTTSYAYYLNYNGSGISSSTTYKRNGMSVRCMRDNRSVVSFNPNGGQITIGERKVERGEEIGALPTPTKGGLIFDGWYTALTDGEKIDEMFAPSGNLTIYAHWKEPVDMGLVYFQDVNDLSDSERVALLESLEMGTAYKLVDQRDGKEYLVEKVSNDTLYMRENLKLDSTTDDTTPRVLTPSDSDVSSNYSMPTWDWGNYYCKGAIKISGDDYRYNWYAAKANPYICDYPVSSSDATAENDAKSLGSICPAGWTLPNYSTDITPSMISDLVDKANLKPKNYYWSRNRNSDYYAVSLYWNDSISRATTYKDSASYVRCMYKITYKVEFNANGGSLDEDKRTIYMADPIGELPVPTKANSDFMGWYTLPDGGELVTNDFVPTGDIKIYAHWRPVSKTINNITYLQDFTSLSDIENSDVVHSMVVNSAYTLKDKRDNKEYSITRLKDNNLFMRENLKLDNTTDGTTPRTLTSEDSDVSADYTMPTEDWTSSSQSYYCKAIMKEYNGEYYYNWYAAKANPYECENPTSTTNATVENDAKSLGSICPAGWTLPDYGVDITLDELYYAPSSSTVYNYGNLTKAGFFSGSISSSGSAGYYWSSARISNYYAYRMYFAPNSNPKISRDSYGGYRIYGQSVRCYRSTPSYILTYNPNGGTTTSPDKVVAKGTQVDSLLTPTRTNYTFVGWYTALIGGEQINGYYIPSSDMTLYAHWEPKNTIPGIDYLQDFADLTEEQEYELISTLSTGVSYSVRDKRDEKEYLIKKLSDGYLYIDENLRLDNTTDGITPRVLTPSDSDVSADFTMPTANWTSASQDYYCKANMAVKNGEYYYNWYAAKANPYECLSPTSSSYATETNDAKSLGSICPAGWTLPNYSTDVLYSSTSWSKTGYYKSGSVSNKDNGYYWSTGRSDNYYAYNVSRTQSSGSRGSNYKYYGMSVRCMRDVKIAITYDMNGGFSNKSGKTIPKGSNLGTLPTPDRGKGYTFAGWFTELTDGEQVTEDFVPGADMTLYAHWDSSVEPLQGATYFQDFSGMTDEQENNILQSMETNAPYMLTDSRDGKQYSVLKLNNGAIYMGQNLELSNTTDGTTARVLSPYDSDVSTNYEMPTDTWAAWYCRAAMTIKNGSYYYNWYAAKANPYKCPDPTSYTNVSEENDAKSLGSICPAGWTLPEYTTDDVPISALSENKSNYAGLQKIGYIDGTSLYNYGTRGNYWSSSRHNDKYNANVLGYRDDNGASVDYYTRRVGMSVRCVRDTKYRIYYNLNGGTSSNILGKRVAKGDEIGELPTASSVSRVGYTFVGWYTELTGGEKVTESFIPSSDTELFAHYEVTFGVSYFQDFDGMTNAEQYEVLKNTEVNEPFVLKDKRDEKEYEVVRLSDGYLFMHENLKLDNTTDGSTRRVLTPTDSDVSADFAMPTRYWGSSYYSYYCIANMKVINGEYYYNWYAAKANPYECANPKNYSSATEESDANSLGSICPAGWTLPDYQNEVHASAVLFNTMNYGGLSGTGQFNGNSQSDLSNGYYWSSKRYDNMSAYSLRYYGGSNTASGTSGSYKDYGLSVRCARGVQYKVTYNTNGGKSDVTEEIRMKGEKMTSLPVPTNTPGIGFVGWYTSIVGGEKVTDDYVISSDMTLYARWEPATDTIDGITYFQDFAGLTDDEKTAVVASLEDNKQYALKDSRDGKMYVVTKLSSGILYMYENLKLDNTTDGTTPRVLTPSDSDVSDDFTMPTEEWTSTSQNYYCKAIMKEYDGEYYYNWYAAKANPYECPSPTSYSYASSVNDAKSLGSICPAGWTMPDYKTDIRIDTLSDRTTNYANLTLNGFFNGSGLSSYDTYGYYWSSARSDDSLVNEMRFYKDKNTSVVTGYKYYGQSVRCMLDHYNSVSYDKNDYSYSHIIEKAKVMKGHGIGSMWSITWDGSGEIPEAPWK